LAYSIFPAASKFLASLVLAPFPNKDHDGVRDHWQTGK